jgi:transcription initiation factor TFIIIB Brf1 subunit/transcription initiation factor TFIIB
MPHNEHLCSHETTIEDERGGCVVCTECGLVLEEKLFFDYRKPFLTEKNETNDEIKELLSRVNLPDSYANLIFKNCLQNPKKSIPYVLYKTLNDDGNPISIKTISSVSGLCDSKIYDFQEKDKIILLKPELMTEKYCKLLLLDFKSTSVIKEKIKNSLKSGHNPLTVIASHIYIHCKENKIKISMKHIARTLNISTISIQRYIQKTKRTK